jgi:hypothetical protein
MRRRAVFDATGAYRYSLTREWDTAGTRVCFVLLNPSAADAAADDPTVRRCIGFARDWGFGALEVVNLFAFRTAFPAALRRADDPVGSENDLHLAKAVARAERTVVGWGVHGGFRDRAAIVSRLLESALCFGRTRDGHPRHPLYLPRTAATVEYRLPRCREGDDAELAE